MFHTGQDLEKIENVMDRDFFMDVTQAIDFGVIDKILDKRQDQSVDADADDESKYIKEKNCIKRIKNEFCFCLSLI